MTQNQIAYHNAQELKRHNLATEEENKRHQLTEEQLKTRSNELAHESNLISKEHYERMDAINAMHYSNQDQYNVAYLSELSRSNVASESIREQQNAINAAAVAETQRHQLVQESLESRLAGNTIYKTAAEVSNLSSNAKYTRQRVEESKANVKRMDSERQLNASKLVNQALIPTLTSAQIRNTQLANTHLEIANVHEAFKVGETISRTLKNYWGMFSDFAMSKGF